jgi:hypothetical protein
VRGAASTFAAVASSVQLVSYLLGVEATYNGVRASPGVRVETAAGANDIAFTRHALNFIGKVGYKLNNPSYAPRQTGMVVFARVGYVYAITDIHPGTDFTKNIARLPSETLQGFTVGANIEAPKFGDKVGIHVSVDALYPSGKLTQTPEDGTSSELFAVWATGHVNYQWKPNLTLEWIYRFSYIKSQFEGASQRLNGGNKARRMDIGHTVMFGLGKKF